MENSLNQKFTFVSLIKYTIPSIITLIIMSFYSMVDGVFVSRFVSTDALSSVNIIYPILNIAIGLGLMLATGSSAVIARKLGENKTDEANQNFTLIIIVGFVLGVALSIVGFIFKEDLISILGGDSLYEYCMDYLKPILLFTPFFILNLLYQILAMTSGKPGISLFLTALGGVINIILDYLFIVPMDMGIEGAAIATSLGNVIPVILATVYFAKGKSLLRFTKPKFDKGVILESCANGSSEMVTNLSTGITTMLYNIVMMNLLGADGVAAITIVVYSQFFITAIYMGFATGVAPIISYNYGDKNSEELQKLIKYSFTFIIGASVIMLGVTFAMRETLITIFAAKGSNVFDIAYNGLGIFAISFLFTGVNIFTSAMFTAFSNGKVSATISFLRSFVFIAVGIILLPKFLGVDGVWLAIVGAELLSLIICVFYVNKYKNIYEYSTNI